MKMAGKIKRKIDPNLKGRIIAFPIGELSLDMDKNRINQLWNELVEFLDSKGYEIE